MGIKPREKRSARRVGSELEVASTRDQNMAAGEHARFVSGKKCDGSGHVLGVQVLF
jgi:hypothetical protein